MNEILSISLFCGCESRTTLTDKKSKVMEFFKITKNGKDLVNGLSKEEAINDLFSIVEDYSNGYVYDNENETIYHETNGEVIAVKGDYCVIAGDDMFEIEIED